MYTNKAFLTFWVPAVAGSKTVDGDVYTFYISSLPELKDVWRIKLSPSDPEWT